MYIASKSNYWSNCAAWTRFTAQIENEPQSDSAKEGECVMWVVDCVLSKEVDSAFEMIGKKHANLWAVTADIANDADKYVTVLSTMGKIIFSEKEVIACELPLIGGRLDTAIVNYQDGVLKVNDFKYGRGVVEVFENPQLVIEAVGLINSFDDPTMIEKVELSIYQPRAIHHDGIFRKWTVTINELISHFKHIVQMAVENDRPDSLATPGKHCKYCPAATQCEALAHSTYEIDHIVKSQHNNQMSAQELSNELTFIRDASSILEARKKAVEAEAMQRAKREQIPFYKVTQRYGHKKFNVPAVVIQQKTGINPFGDSELVTPAELIRRSGNNAEIKEIINEQLTKAPMIGHKLVRITKKEIEEMFNG